MKDKLIIIVDDDPEMLSSVADCLKHEGFNAKGFPGAEELFDFLEKETPDLVILDVMLPGMNGFEICRKIKKDEKYKGIPIIMLTGMHRETDKVSGLDLGADDYVVKPFSIEELNARIRAILRRQGKEAPEEKINIGSILEIDLKRYQVRLNGAEIELTLAEFKILALLASIKGQVFSREKILEHLWGQEKIVIERTVDVHIRHLREKLGEASRFIKNVRGVGYKIDEDSK